MKISRFQIDQSAQVNFDSLFLNIYKRSKNQLNLLVIGRGGEQIKRMQMESQCKIRIASDSDGTAERSCTLTGSQEAIE